MYIFGLQNHSSHSFFSKLTSVLFLSALLFMVSCGGEKAEQTNASQTDNIEAVAVKQTVQEPFEDVGLDVTEFVIEDPSKASVFTAPSGTKIAFPADAFVMKDGSPYNGPVTIQYEEMHNASEIILSGIPMRVYDTEGKDEWMQTAGMFEIRGLDETGHRINMREGKSIEMDFVSRVDGDYDFWSFNEETGNWNNEGTSNAQPIVSETSNGISDSLPVESLEPKKPVQPKEDKANKLTFSDLDYSACPDLKNGPSPALVYAGTDEVEAPDNNPWIKRPNIWLKKELKPTQSRGIYELTLVGDSLYRIPVRKAIGKEDFAAAQAAYEKELVAYQEKIRVYKNRQKVMAQQAAFRRTMSFSQFGIFNYDLLLKQREAVRLLADFDFGEDLPESVKELVVVYLVTGDGRTVVCFPYYDWKKFRFLPSSDNLMVAVLPTQEVALFTQQDFEQQRGKMQASAGQDFVFDMRVQDGEIHKPEDLQAAIDKCLL